MKMGMKVTTVIGIVAAATLATVSFVNAGTSTKSGAIQKPQDKTQVARSMTPTEKTLSTTPTEKVLSTTTPVSKFVKNGVSAVKASTKTYGNSKFGFSIAYPSNWKISKESDSGDGVILYTDGHNDIRVYARYANVIDSDFEANEASQKGYEVTPMKNKIGEYGFLVEGSEGTDIVFQYVVRGVDTVCVLNAKMSKDFYQKNQQKLLDMAYSLKTSN